MKGASTHVKPDRWLRTEVVETIDVEDDVRGTRANWLRRLKLRLRRLLSDAAEVRDGPSLPPTMRSSRSIASRKVDGDCCGLLGFS
jgi:hypothetical protein